MKIWIHRIIRVTSREVITEKKVTRERYTIQYIDFVLDWEWHRKYKNGKGGKFKYCNNK